MLRLRLVQYSSIDFQKSDTILDIHHGTEAAGLINIECRGLVLCKHLVKRLDMARKHNQAVRRSLV